MTPPRWFFPVVAGCAVVLTGAVAITLILLAQNGRYSYTSTRRGAEVFDGRTGVVCNESACRLLTQAGVTAKVDSVRRATAESSRLVAQQARIAAQRAAITDDQIDSALSVGLDSVTDAQIASEFERALKGPTKRQDSMPAAKPR